MLISCYSFTAVAQRAEKLMPCGGSLRFTLTYYGAEKWMPHYNVMGVAEAVLEASVRYLAADLGAGSIRFVKDAEAFEEILRLGVICGEADRPQEDEEAAS